MSDLFVTLEGIDGCGKSSQVELLAAALSDEGRSVLTVREPGSTPVAERVRAILLDGTADIVPRAELMLYLACRAQLVETTIRPALDDGTIVIADRFIDSSVAYQGYGRDLGANMVARGNSLATGDLIPDLTFVLDLPVSVAVGRRGNARGDRLESEATEFHERVREGFLSLAEMEPDRVVVVDGSMNLSEVSNSIAGHLRLRFPDVLRKNERAY